MGRKESTSNKQQNHHSDQSAQSYHHYNNMTNFKVKRERCVRCKMHQTFNCEHDMPVKKDLANIYAEEGRYYMTPKRTKEQKEDSPVTARRNPKEGKKGKANSTEENKKSSDGCCLLM